MVIKTDLHNSDFMHGQHLVKVALQRVIGSITKYNADVPSKFILGDLWIKGKLRWDKVMTRHRPCTKVKQTQLIVLLFRSGLLIDIKCNWFLIITRYYLCFSKHEINS